MDYKKLSAHNRKLMEEYISKHKPVQLTDLSDVYQNACEDYYKVLKARDAVPNEPSNNDYARRHAYCLHKCVAYVLVAFDVRHSAATYAAHTTLGRLQITSRSFPFGDYVNADKS